MDIDLLVYGFSRKPGALPEIMNVGVGGLRMKFRGLAEEPCFTGHDAVILPFDTYYSWMEGGDRNHLLSDIHLRTRVEVLRAAAAGVTVGFLYEDCFAHFADPGDLLQRSLGAMTLNGLGLSPVPLPAPEDDLEVLASPFECYLRRFGICESYLKATRRLARLHPICRTSAHQLTGVAAEEGKGRILFLPGDPRNRFLEFFTVLGEALHRFQCGKVAGTSFIFAAERALLAEREMIAEQSRQNERRLDTFRRRRELLALVAADPDRFLPEWFSTFLGLELQVTTEAGCYHLLAGAGRSPPPSALVAVAIRSAGDALVALQEIRAQQVGNASLPADAAIFLYLTDEALHDTTAGSPLAFDLEGAAHEVGIGLLRPVDLFRLLDESNRHGRPVALADLQRVAGLRPSPAPAPALEK